MMMAVHQEILEKKPKVIKPVSETRKVRKPLMERRRRERINSSLEQLALLLKEANMVAKDKPLSKMEKADILELTVCHLKGVRGIQPTQQYEAKQHELQDDIDNIDNLKNPSTQDGANSEVINDNKSLFTKEYLIANSNQLELSPGNVDTDTTDFISSDSRIYEEGQLIIDESSTVGSSNSETVFTASTDSVSEGSYLDGFYKCLHEVKQATTETKEFAGLKQRLVGHLESCFKTFTTSAPQLSNVRVKRKGIKRELLETNESDNSSDIPHKKVKLDDDNINNNNKLSVPNKLHDATVAPVPGLTLVPMRLADGAMAFFLQGDAQSGATESSTEQKTINSGSSVNFSLINSDIENVQKLVNIPPNKLTITSSWNKANTIPTQQSFIPNNFMAPISININGTQGVISSSKILPKVKTVTLPIGTVAAAITCTQITTIDSKLGTNTNSISILPNSCFKASNLVSTPQLPTLCSATPSKSNYVRILSKPLMNTVDTTVQRQTPNKDIFDQSVTISLSESSNLIGSNLNQSNVSIPTTFPSNQLPIIQQFPITSSIESSNISISKNINKFSNQLFNPSIIGQPEPISAHLEHPTSHSLNTKIINPAITIYPPTPPPSVSLCTDQWAPNSPPYDSQSFSSTQQTYTLLSSSPISSYSCSSANLPLVHNNTPAQSDVFSNCPNSSMMSLVSSSVQLLGGADSTDDFCLRQSVEEQGGDDEFIDVENDPTDVVARETGHCSGQAHNNNNNNSENWNQIHRDLILLRTKEDQTRDMWRPW